MDKTAVLWIAGHLRNGPMSCFFIFFTTLGNAGFLWIVCSFVMLFLKRWRWTGISAFTAMLLCFVLGELLMKELICRPRPPLQLDELSVLLPLPSGFSFPSGHAASSFAAAGAFSRGIPLKWVKVLFFALAALMGFSRVYLGVHYPSDVLAGAGLGLLCGFAAWELLRPLRKHFRSQ